MSRFSDAWKAKSNSSSVLRAGNFAAALAAVRVARVGLGLKQGGGELLERPVLGAGAVRELRERPRCGGRLERAEQMRQLGRGARHAISAS